MHVIEGTPQVSVGESPKYTKLNPPPLHPEAVTVAAAGGMSGFSAEQELRMRALSRAKLIVGSGASVWDAISAAEYILRGSTATTDERE